MSVIQLIMSSSIANYLKTKPTYDSAHALQNQMITGHLEKSSLLQIFDYYEKFGLDQESLAGIVNATKHHMIQLQSPDQSIVDTCGTGGDQLNTFNISTAASFVAAGAGIKIAKHGNRAASSQCGTADVLEALGVHITLSPEQALHCLKKTGLTFLFAPLYHPALKHVKEARTAYGKPTYFNIIGPMMNPMATHYQVIGVTNHQLIDLMATTLIKLGSKRICFVAGDQGLDEASLSGPTTCHLFEPNKPKKTITLHPHDFDLETQPITTVKGGSPHENAQILTRIWTHKSTKAQKNITLLNAMLAIFIISPKLKLKTCFQQAKDSLESGKAHQVFCNFLKESHTK